MDEGFSRQARRFDAGILCVFQGKATKYDGKRPAQAALTACEYRFLVCCYLGCFLDIAGCIIAAMAASTGYLVYAVLNKKRD